MKLCSDDLLDCTDVAVLVIPDIPVSEVYGLMGAILLLMCTGFVIQRIRRVMWS